MKFKNFIFDVDGTILDSKYQTVKAYDLLAREILGRGLTPEEEIFAFHKTSVQTLDLLEIETSEENMMKLYNYFHDLSLDVGYFEGVTEVLDEMKMHNVFIGLATNRNKGESDYALYNNGLKKYFDDYVCKDDVKNAKPSGEMLTLYMERHNLNPDDTIFIGNAIGDHMAAIDAGIKYGLCKWGTEEFLDEDAIEFEEPKDILKLL